VLGLIPRQAAAPVHHQRGGVYVRLRRFADAVADYDRALEIDPGLCMVYISRGNARYHLRDLAAQADYWTAFQLDQRSAAAEIIRVLDADVREDAGAVLKNCRQHLRICPEDIVASARRGLTLLLLGRPEEAEAYLHRVVQIGPEWADYLDLLVAAAGRQRNREVPEPENGR
jgi:tetratricopeptide (TPR) repeat protein